MIEDINNEDPNEDLTHPLLKTGIYSGASMFCILLLTFGSCTMHSNTYDGVRLAGEAEIERTLTERAIAESTAHKEQKLAETEANREETLAIERLIGSGVNPVAARCAVKGWSTHDREACVLAGTRVNAN